VKRSGQIDKQERKKKFSTQLEKSRRNEPRLNERVMLVIITPVINIKDRKEELLVQKEEIK
jgi:hypothetical protein